MRGIPSVLGAGSFQPCAPQQRLSPFPSMKWRHYVQEPLRGAGGGAPPGWSRRSTASRPSDLRGVGPSARRPGVQRNHVLSSLICLSNGLFRVCGNEKRQLSLEIKKNQNKFVILRLAPTLGGSGEGGYRGAIRFRKLGFPEGIPFEL